MVSRKSLSRELKKSAVKLFVRVLLKMLESYIEHKLYSTESHWEVVS